jgi:hypothetical protein
MSATEVWCLVAVVAAGLSAGLAAVAPRDPAGLYQRAAQAALGAAVLAIAVALWIALP